MTFQVIHLPNGGAQSPFHIVQTRAGREVEWVNRFLDRECIRCLAETTLRSYAMDLLHFVRWWASVHHSHAITGNALTSVLTDYVRFQAGQRPRPAPATINRRVIVVGRALRNEFPDAIRTPEPGFSSLYWLTFVTGLRTGAACSEPPPGERTQTYPNPVVGGSGRPVLVRIPQRA
jgi:hypothetical protein